MAEVHVLRADTSALRLVQLIAVLEEQVRNGADLGPRRVQIEALGREIERSTCAVLAEMDRLSRLVPSDDPEGRRLAAVLETLRQMTQTLQTHARALSAIQHQMALAI